jgi:outer membrane biosynthesis protein TonB
MGAPKMHMRGDQAALRGFGTDPIRSDLPLGSIASLIFHGGLVLGTLFAWQITPRIMPEDIIAVDVVSDVPSVKGENTSPETDQLGVDTPNPSPLPQPLESSPATETPTAAPIPAPMEAPQEQALAPPPPQVQPAQPLPPPPPVQRAAPSAKPLPQTPVRPPPLPTRPTAKAPTPQRAPAPAREGRTRETSTTPPEFDLAAASTAASGSNSGGRAPQLSSRGQAGRAGQAGGGTQLTGDLEAALRSQIKECWLEPADMSNPRSLLVVVSIDLGIDGRLTRDPVLVSPASKAGASPSLVVAIDNALRAVRQCAPFTLPPDRYETWRQVRFSFDPRRMARP